MTRFALLFSLCVPLALASSCATIGAEHVSVEGHAIVYDAVDATASVGGFTFDGDVDTKGWGAEVAFHSLDTGPAVLVGFDQREYEDADAREYSVGLRQPLISGRIQPYLEGKVRYGDGIEVDGGDSDDYVGWAAGGGVLLWATDQIFLNLNFMYEDVFDHIRVQNADVDLDGWVGTAGIGFSF